MGKVIQIRDYHLRRLEAEAKEIMGRVIDYSEVVRLGGPGGIDDLIFVDTSPCEMNPYYAPESDPA